MAFTSSMMQQSLDTSRARRVRPRAAPASAAGLVAGRCDETRCCAGASEVNTTTSQHGSCFLPHEEEKEKSRRGRGRGSSALCASTEDESGAISISSYISAHGFTFWQIKPDCSDAMRQSPWMQQEGSLFFTAATSWFVKRSSANQHLPPTPPPLPPQQCNNI